MLIKRKSHQSRRAPICSITIYSCSLLTSSHMDILSEHSVANVRKNKNDIPKRIRFETTFTLVRKLEGDRSTVESRVQSLDDRICGFRSTLTRHRGRCQKNSYFVILVIDAPGAVLSNNKCGIVVELSRQ